VVPDQGPVRRRSGVAHRHGVLLHIRAERIVGVAGNHGDPGRDPHARHGRLGCAEEGGGGGVALAASGLGMSTVIALTQEQEDARKYLSATSLLLTLLATGAIIRRVRLHAEINMLTVLAAVCINVLLGLSFAFVFECLGEFGSRPFFTAHEAGRRSDYTYFSFVTMATVGYGDLTAQGGLGRAFAVTEGLLGQIYLVTTVAALVGNLGRTRTPTEEMAPERDEGGPE
jgi:hypothetical protein